MSIIALALAACIGAMFTGSMISQIRAVTAHTKNLKLPTWVHNVYGRGKSTWRWLHRTQWDCQPPGSYSLFHRVDVLDWSNTTGTSPPTRHKTVAKATIVALVSTQWVSAQARFDLLRCPAPYGCHEWAHRVASQTHLRQAPQDLTVAIWQSKSQLANK